MPTTKKTINPDLEKERRKCTFDVEELARYWIGDSSKLEEKRARGKFLVIACLEREILFIVNDFSIFVFPQ